jgi:hypothetical protein
MNQNNNILTNKSTKRLSKKAVSLFIYFGVAMNDRLIGFISYFGFLPFQFG